MSISIHRTGLGIPLAVWDAKAIAQAASVALGAVVERTFNKGLGDDDQPMKPYSTRPITIAFESDTGRRLKPKGGLPAYGVGLGVTDRTSFDNEVTPARPVNKRADFGWSFLFREKGDTGNTGRKMRGRIIGRHYPGGYAEYKRSSRKGLTNKLGASGVSPDLVLSGQLSRSVVILRSDRYSFTIGIRGASLETAIYTDAKRPWLALSPADVADLDAAVVPIVENAMARSARRESR